MVAILDQMEEFDEEIRPARLGAKEFANLAKRVPVKLPPLGKARARFREPTLRARRSGPPLVAVFCSTLFFSILSRPMEHETGQRLNRVHQMLTALGADRQVSPHQHLLFPGRRN